MEPLEPHPNDPTPGPALNPEAHRPVGPLSTWELVRSSPWACAVLSIVLTGVLGCGLMWLSLGVFESYGPTLFCLSPVFCSFTAVILHRWARPEAGGRIWPVAWAVVGVMAMLASMVFLLASGGEGLICVAMALPFALLMALVGAALGQAVVNLDGRPNPLPMLTAVLVLYPAAQEYEARTAEAPTPHLVRSQLVVNAPPARVWAVLMQPVAYPPASGWFRAGVVYPTRTAFALDSATGQRTLVCHYSQGNARLPVVAWEPGRALTFAVPPPHMPAPMRELSPYPQIHAPHLHGYFQVDSGTFRLRPLPGGRTVLEARTVYRHAIGPRTYWQLWSDYLLDAMHTQVLATLKTQAERQHD